MSSSVIEHLRAALDLQRAAFRADCHPSETQRLERLARVREMTVLHQARLVQAINEDFGGRARQETLLADLFTVTAAIRHAKRHLHGWMKPRWVRTELQFLPGHNRLLRQPLGVVGVLPPWNYPYQLVMGPAVAALAAGNRVMLKPSELTPNFSALLATLVCEYFNDDEMQVVTGDADVGRAFSSLRFDHLVFTGSTEVGRHVAQAAARNLTPTTLELGGKSPAIVDASCDLAQAAPRLAYGKLLNGGQSCVAPDYVLVPRARRDDVAAALLSAMRSMYPQVHGNPDYTHIINTQHHARLRGLLDDARQRGARLLPMLPDVGATWASRQLMPTLVLDPTEDMALMRQEIFGPILPIVGYDQLGDAIDFVNARERPLALYWFGKNAAARDRVLRETVSGGVTINDCIWHQSQENQPFGGVGASGHGAYHGEWGFKTFSQEKPVFHQSRFAGTWRLRPPYGQGFERLLGLLHRLA